MGGGWIPFPSFNNVIDSVTQAAQDAAAAVMAGVAHVSPIIDHVIDPFDILPDAVRIPGTDLYVSLGSFLLGPFIGLPFIPFRRQDFATDTTEIYSLPPAPTNPYLADLKLYLNNSPADGILFQTPTEMSSPTEVTKYFKENISYAYSDVCVNIPNSTLQLIFNDTDFTNNDGFVNVSVCYLGDTDDCNCKFTNEDLLNNIGVGFSSIDPYLTYPVSCHGMVYVGDKDNGLSTGGRCEKSDLSSAETKLNQKYFNKYSTYYDESESENNLEESRVLDLVYKYNGSSWIRQQNLIESVYYHSGVGDQNSALFFGGIHETMTNYSFNYHNDLSNLPIPNYSDLHFDNKVITNILYENLYGTYYPPDLNSSTCWTTPFWANPSNFNGPTVIVNNPIYAPSLSANYLGYIRDPDFPKVYFTSIQPNGSFEFGTTAQAYREVFGRNLVCLGSDVGGHILFGGSWEGVCYEVPNSTLVETTQTLPEAISGSYVKFNYPNISTLNMSADLSSAFKNKFIIKASTRTISGTPVDMYGEIKIKNIQLSYKNKTILYPNDVSFNSITNEKTYLSLKSINSNSENVNLVGAFQHSFNYTSTISSQTSGYVNRGLFTLRFNSLNNIRDAIISKQFLLTSDNFTVFDCSTFPTSASYLYGTGSVYFDINDLNAVMVGVDNKNYNWVDTLENSKFNISSKLNLNATIGTKSEERWGTPLWSAPFVDNCNYYGNYKFNSRTDINDGNNGDILHDISNLLLESNSIMALANNRIKVTGNSLSQEHKFSALNNAQSKGTWNVGAYSYTPNSIGDLYYQNPNLNINTNCKTTFTPLDALTNVSGTMVSSGAVCCSNSYTYPDHLFLISADSVPVSADDGLMHLHVKYNYVDECIWKIDSMTYTPNITGQTNNFTYTSNCIFSCPDTAIESLATGYVTTEYGDVFNFPSTNFILNTISASTPISSGYTKQVSFNFYDSKQWQPYSVEYTVLSTANCTLSTNIPIAPTNNNYNYGTLSSVISGNYIGQLNSTGSTCCNGLKNFPNNFTLQNTTMDVSGGVLYGHVLYYLYNNCSSNPQAQVKVTLKAKQTGILYSNIESCPAGVLDLDIQTCKSICQNTLIHTNSVVMTIPSSGNAYAEYATNFIQQYKPDSRYKVPEYLVTSNANNNITKNNGIFVGSQWKRYMDGTGLGGDAPNYDTIKNPSTNSAYQLINWSEVGTWNIGQMAFGTPDNAVIVGGHKVSRNVGNTLIGSGLHASKTSKRVYIWSTTSIAEEDSYLKNYYGRRFNTYYNTTSYPISSNQNKSHLSCIIFDAQSPIVTERIGNVMFDGSTNFININFDTPMSDDIGANYSISLTPSDNVKVWWENKTKTGFTLKCEMNNWNGRVDYLATTISKVTESDITQKGAEDGYIFSK